MRTSFSFASPYIVFGIAFPLSIVNGIEPLPTPVNEQSLLRLVPKSSESVFCINTAAQLRPWNDLTQASVFEAAFYFTTLLSSQHSNTLNLSGARILCAVSAVKQIRAPKTNPATKIANGWFQSHRCELLLLSSDPPEKWLDTVLKSSKAKTVDIENQKVLEFSTNDHAIWLLQVDARVLCVSNNKAMLKELVQIIRGKELAASIVNDHLFEAALSYLSRSSECWGIRLHDRPVSENDLTSPRNQNPIAGIHDSKAVFTGMEIATAGSKELRLLYATGNSDGASGQFITSLGTSFHVGRPPLKAIIDGDKANNMIVFANCSLNRAPDENVDILLGACVLFGYGGVL